MVAKQGKINAPSGAGAASFESPAKTKSAAEAADLFGAENETRTRDPDLGKVVLYQLSYFRLLFV